MPRYRKLHTKIVESMDFDEMPDDTARLMWVLLPLKLCQNGCGVYRASWLKSMLFPLRDDLSGDDVWQRFQWFVRKKMVRPYEVNGRSYFWIPTFARYQGDTSKEAESDYPLPPELVESRSGVGLEEVESK